MKGMPPISEELEHQITQDLIAAFQAKFGDTWPQNLTRNLRPSPNKAIAERYGVSTRVVTELKHRLWLAGMLLNAAAQAVATTPELEPASNLLSSS